MPEIGAYGSVRGGGGNILTYSDDRIGVARRRRIRRRDQLLPASSVVQRPALSEAVLLANVSHAVGLAAAESRRVVDIFTEFKSWAGRCLHGLRKASRRWSTLSPDCLPLFA